MKTQIKVWSKIGCTPITGRIGAFCDVLVDKSFDCESPVQAAELVAKLVEETHYAASGHYDMPEWPNQNDRNRFCGYRP